MCVFEADRMKVRVTAPTSPSLFLLRPEPAVSTHETRIMGRLFREAYYGRRTQHISLPHTQTHTHANTRIDTYTIIGDRNQPVPLLSDRSEMMLWILQIPKWSGLLLFAIDDCCRRLPNSKPTCNKTRSMKRYYAHEVM